ncbi:NADH dehydrogenase subunit A [Siphonobacter aquaeclarae]|jgi:NADH-quinone oxidoreductase subunit A|uniref:NADH-quinone oxidoreductase subunit A n=2 Tax=Siphonobacter aquaeclarae TaxID=563176 RepID=A0A1G9Q7T4_9BACT|nr:NADH dehydrogenase subunit A [Siphonobacter aquaeclarae]
MMLLTSLPSDFAPVFVQFLAAMGFIVMTMLATHLLTGTRKKTSTARKEDPWECGIPVYGDARTPISVKYFLTAILFVLFDVEIIFMYPWAVNFIKFKQDGLGMLMFGEMIVFMVLLLAGFYYVIKKGVLKWDQD